MTKVVEIRESVMAADEAIASRIRAICSEKGILMINLIGSPGSGKTTVLEATVRNTDLRYAVIEGDVATTRDADRIAALNIPVVQINTHGGCHLEANLVARAFEEIPLDELDIIVVENVGNLVCPVEFDLGEDRKIAVNSVPEGSDKPLKYPHLFHKAGAVLLTKTDLLPYIAFDLELFEKDVKNLNPHVPLVKMVATEGKGIEEWEGILRSWLEEKRKK
ncbi:MAG TPA: hydrogenase nickel incorporation protein HypB [Synergistales bacterium]|nr:hydrogenase nickel incorporation protein HypB [Synergistales bacterium]